MKNSRRTRCKPEIPAELREVTSLNDPRLSDDCAAFTISHAGIVALGGRPIEQAVFTHCDLSRLVAPGLRLHNVRMEQSDCANADFTDSFLDCVEFHSCRLTGACFSGSRILDTLFDSAMADYALFRSVKLRFAEFVGTVLSEAEFYGSDLTGARFLNCDLRRAEFSNTRASGVDIRSCQVEGLKIDLESAAGLVIDASQAPYFMHLLKIRVL